MNEVLKGQRFQWALGESTPFAFGRASQLYRAYDSAGREVCIKRFTARHVDPEQVQSYRRELSTQSSLNHPNILPILDYSADGRELFVVTPMCHGGDLRAILDDRDFLPLNAALPLLRQVASAVDHAHQHGVIHGDIKPENVLLSADQRTAYLADFGVAKYFAVEERLTTLPLNLQRGTSAYMSPEQLTESRQYPSSDVYSLSMVAFETLAGALPFDVNSPAYQQMRAKIEGSLLRVREVNDRLPPRIDRALAAGLSAEPAARPATAIDLIEMLEGNKEVESLERSAEVEAESSSKSGLSKGQWTSIVVAAIGATAAILEALFGLIGQIISAVLGGQ